MNYDAERAMNNQKRLRMEGEAGHGVVQGNGLPLGYMDNGHQIPYQPYAGAYNTHYPPEAFSAYGPPPPGGYAPQNLSYAPPAHQNYPHHQGFPQQLAQQHMPQPHMVQGYGGPGDVVHKPAWPPQPHLLAPLEAKPLEVKPPKPEIKLEPAESQKRPHPPEELVASVDLEQPKIKIKTDIFKPDDVNRQEPEKPHEVPVVVEIPPVDKRPEENKTDGLNISSTDKPEACKAEKASEDSGDAKKLETTPTKDTSGEPKSNESTPSKTVFGMEPKKRGRPKGSTNKPKLPGAAGRVLTPNAPNAPAPLRPPAHSSPSFGQRAGGGVGRPRGTSYQYAVRPFRKDFSGIQFRRRWSDDCLDSSHIPNEVYFGDVPVSTEVLFNYYDANAEREKLAAQAAQIAAQKAAAAKLAAAKLQARGLISNEVTTVDSSSSESSSGESDSDSSDSDDDAPLKKTKAKKESTGAGGGGAERRTSTGTGTGRRGRPPVPPELREPGITDMKKFCKAAGIRFDYKKLTEGCTKNKERVQKLLDLLIKEGLEGKPTLEKCKALKQAKVDKKDEAKRAKQQAKSKPKAQEAAAGGDVPRRMTRGATGSKPRQKIVISSEEEDDTPDARRTLSKLRSMVQDESDSD